MNDPRIHWYNLSIEEALARCKVDGRGLGMEEVEARRGLYGANVIPQPRGKTLLGIFFSQFMNPLIYVLVVAGIISAIAKEASDALFITAIIVINAILGTWQEWKAEFNAAALKNLVKIKARVKRGDKMYEVDADELVPGDLVLLESGVKVPADLRLVEANDITIEEALLTGESLPVIKSTEALHVVEPSLGDQLNMAFAATTVLKGRARGLVVHTGTFTELGKIASSLSTSKAEKPPLIQRMDVFSQKISVAVVVICFLLGLLGWLRGMPLVEIFFLMVAVGVSAIPEGLPVALTVALSIGTIRMARRNVIVRKLPAVEGLGSCTLIASDKTGTLTMDQQTVKQLLLPGGNSYSIGGVGYNGEGEMTGRNGPATLEKDGHLQNFLMAAILANEAILRKTETGWEHSGDAVDVSLRALAYKVGKQPSYFKQGVEIVQMVPYESENKYSGVFYRHQDQLYFAMKGAAEVVSSFVSEHMQNHWLVESEKMALEGFRILALAGAPVSSTNLKDLPELEMYGLAGLIDPLRPQAAASIKECREAGINVIMITGDHPATAFAIAKQLGLAESDTEVISGKELAVIEEKEPNLVASRIANKKVFARVTPLQKKEIVESMKENGHFVAVTGDGANDAPALKIAHIGIAMGGGTDLAKESSSIVVADNNFSSIAAGVEEGRFTYDNLRKIIYLLISTGMAEIVMVALPMILGMPLPLVAVQLLWLNLVTNGIQDIALAFEKGDIAVMKKPPRSPKESIFDKQMVEQVVVSAIVMSFLAVGLWYIMIQDGMNEKHARSLVMMLMVLMQNFHVLNCRSETKSLFSIPLTNNWTIIIGIALAQAVHIGASYTPGLRDVLQLEPVTAYEWIRLIPTACIIFLSMEVFKWWKRRSLSVQG